MKKVILLLFVLISINSFGQAPSWQWAKKAGCDIYDYLNGSAVDASGNLYITGVFEDDCIDFGNVTLVNANSPSYYSDGMYIAKYDVNGNVVWAKGASILNGNSGGCSIAVDASGNSFVIGYFKQDTIVFDNITLLNGGSDIFIVKYDTNGNAVWAKSPGSSGQFSNMIYPDMSGLSLTTDALGNFYATGYFSCSTLVFGADTLHNNGTANIFVVKYDNNGNEIWAKSAGGTGVDESNSMSVDAMNNVYVSGQFTSPTLLFGTTILLNNGTENMFVLKYNANGNPLWAKCGGGAITSAGANSIKADDFGNVYVTGYFEHPWLVLGTITLSNTTNHGEMFLVKYDSLGNALWARIGTDDSYGTGVSTDNYGNVYATGHFNNPIFFGSTTLAGTVNGDSYVVEYSPTGTALWAKEMEGCYSTSISNDANGSTYISGYFYVPFVILSNSITLTNAENWGDVSDIYVGKLDATTGIAENKFDDGFSIYPNPFTSQTTISFSEEQKNTKLKVINVLGETIQQLTTNNKQLTLDMSGVANGIYFIEAETAKGIVRKKIVKE